MNIVRHISFVATITLMLSACSIGIKEGSQYAVSISFSAPITYQEAYRRADAYARHCRSDGGWGGLFNVSGNVFTDTKTGVIHINKANTGSDLERINIATAGNASSINIEVWGVGIWDEREMGAAKRSILTGTPICRKDLTS